MFVLDCSVRKNCPLASADRALKKAATALGIALVSAPNFP
jgi:hypothetical protein